MNLPELVGFSSSLLIGISLGLIGGGGSILTLPVLVYLLGIDPTLSTSYSLFIVGVTSLVGALDYVRKGLVDYKAAAIFVTPSLLAVYFTRSFLVPAIPPHIELADGFAVSRKIVIMVFFAIFMLAAALSMIWDAKLTKQNTATGTSYNPFVLAGGGLLIGLITGVVGAGGGFLIIPTLVLLAKIPMKTAVGTSLLIIAIKSLIGFTGDDIEITVNWRFLLVFSSLSVMGIFLGSYLAGFVPATLLKRIFGWTIFVMSIGIIVKELLLDAGTRY